MNADIIVIGGGVSNLGDLLFEPMHEAARSMVIDPAYYDHAAIVPAALGEDVAHVVEASAPAALRVDARMAEAAGSTAFIGEAFDPTVPHLLHALFRQ